MLSLRSLARSAPRSLSRLAHQTARPASASLLLKTSTISALRPAAALPTNSSCVSSSSFFSTSTAARRAADSELDDELSAKLESEIQIEQDIKANEQQPASIKDFLDNTPFQLIDTPGQEVVKLTRSFGDEKITVSFSIADITNFDPYSEDPALDDEDLHDEPSSGPNKQSPKAQEEDLDEDVDDLGEEEPSAPINLSIVIEKPGKTPAALAIDATAQDGLIVVENMFHYEDATVARVESPEAAQKRADVYPGPPFGSLDEDLQALVERFLEERGVNQAMAVFVPDYVDVKEQAEYLRWLSNVKTFVDV